MYHNGTGIPLFSSQKPPQPHRPWWFLCSDEASLHRSSKFSLHPLSGSVLPLEVGIERKKNKGEVSNIWKQSNQGATFKWSHLRPEPPSCLGVPAEPTAKHSSGHLCHWLQADGEDALASNVQSMINLFLLILMLLQLQQMFKSLLAVIDPHMVLTPYQASNDNSHRFPGLCHLDFYHIFFPSGKFCGYSGELLYEIWCVQIAH